ncbi:RecBCD enzyme subunit RecC [Gammaproteobacteria bacterium]
MVVEWLRDHPLKPLENEIVLVQSNGMAQWLKFALADNEGLGICAAIKLQLPARFLWSAYQAVLGSDAVPKESLFDREMLTWRLFRLLPKMLADPCFEPLRRYTEGTETIPVEDWDARKQQQLVTCLADLFDQYQVYRADWLRDWADGRDQLRDAHGKPHPIPKEQHWQPALWRALLKDVPIDLQQTSRALLHERFLASLEQVKQRPSRLPRRIVVFGISSLPQQMIYALAALARFCQVLLCVHNPCRYYWADIIEHKDLLRAQRRRQQSKPQMPTELKDEELHLHANPLLAAWGRQGRDYIRLLDEFDSPEDYQEWFQRIDLFDDFGAEDERSLLQQIQQSILDLMPLPQAPDDRPLISPDDTSLVFHIAHSSQREVEILHDQLLALFTTQDTPAGNSKRLRPRDVIVMVPDIDSYAPHIRAVFGKFGSDSPQYIPFSLADQRERGRNPVLIALDLLLRLPESRFAVSDLLDLLEVSAIRERFNIAEADLATLRSWIEGAGIRWGLDAEQRTTLDLPSGLEQNSWQFGLNRMLLGYSVGSGEPWNGIEPYEEIGGLSATLVGPLARLLEILRSFWHELSEPAPPTIWKERLRRLLAAFFLPTSERDTLILEQLASNLEDWEERCQHAGFESSVTKETELSLAVVREAWLAGTEGTDKLSQRFLAGRVNFCTLLPMRAIPFEVVCLMGMNDGDYPRRQLPFSFDLMNNGGYRPGDRSRREDDRYLFLEALLSARRKFYLSWVGRSVQDNGEHPPSVLVEQLRDTIIVGWQAEEYFEKEVDAEYETIACDAGRILLERLTLEHPLQPFSPRYFLPTGVKGHDERLFSYADEWRSTHPAAAHDASAIKASSDSSNLSPYTPEAPLTLETLAGFLRYPVRTFFNGRLKVWFETNQATNSDLEPFVFDALKSYTLGDEVLHAALTAPYGSARTQFKKHQERQRRRGELPMAGFAEPALAKFSDPAWAAYEYAERLYREWSLVQNMPQEIRLEFSSLDGPRILLEDWLPGLRRNAKGRWAQILVRPKEVKGRDGRPKWHSLVRPWLRHLAGCAAGLDLSTLQVGTDGIVQLSAIVPTTAYARLSVVLEGWCLGMRRPFPLACRTAFVWLEKTDAHPETARDLARKEYEGGYHNGEIQQDPYLKRAFPCFDTLWNVSDDQGFEYWAQQLYEPLRQNSEFITD